MIDNKEYQEELSVASNDSPENDTSQTALDILVAERSRDRDTEDETIE